MDPLLLNTLEGIVRSGAPLVLAAIGEVFTERAGIVNLSLDGSLMLSALAGFIVGVSTNSVLLGTLAASLVGMCIALLVAFSSIKLKQSQVAVGFVLTLLCRDIAIFLGETWRNTKGIRPPFFDIPLLRDIPIIGPILFQQDAFTYLSYIAVIAAWFWIFRTRPGLALRSVGERPETSFARGLKVNRLRYLYTALGGSLVGIGGAAYTLNITSTWNEAGILGNGWIALAIVIFGGWHPVRVMLGVYLVAGLRAIINNVQTSANAQMFQLLLIMPWILMLFALLIVSNPYANRFIERLPTEVQPLARAVLRAKAPAALGTRFEQD